MTLVLPPRNGGAEKDNFGGCKTWEEELYWNRFQSFYFCHNLSLVTDFHKHLTIPKKFAKNASALLPPKVTLRGPSRATWSCIITKRGDDLLLTEGWVDFVMAYSLRASDILIFKFDGVSVFDILIFDGWNMCEKEYAYFVKNRSREDAETSRKRTASEAGIGDDEDDEDSEASRKRARFYDRLKKRHLRKAIFSDSSFKALFPDYCADEKDQSNAENEPPSNVNEPLYTSYGESDTDESFSTKVPLTDERIIHEAIPLRTTSVMGGCRKESGVKSSSSKRASCVGRKRKQLGSKKLPKDFSPGRRYVPEEVKVALEMAREQMSASSFILVMRASAVCKRFILTLPPAWCRKHLSLKSQYVLFRFGSQTFETRLSYGPGKSTGQICGGWKPAVVKTQLKMFDVCLFNLVYQKEDAVMLDVSVFRGGLQKDPMFHPSHETDEPSSPIRDEPPSSPAKDVE